MATQKLKDLSTKFDENESNWKRAGDTFEIVVCRELRATKGFDYARSFKIKDLHDLACIALPKDVRAEDRSYQLCSEKQNLDVDDVDDVLEDLLVKMSKPPLLSSCVPTAASPSLASLTSYNMGMASSEKLSLVTKLLMRYVLSCFTTSDLTSIVTYTLSTN